MTRRGWTIKDTLFAVLLALLVAGLALTLCSTPANAADLVGEIGCVKPFAPDLTLDMGLTASTHLFTVGGNVPVLGGRSIYADLLVITSNGKANPLLGGSITLYETTRVGAAVWRESNTRWSLYLVQPFCTF